MFNRRAASPQPGGRLHKPLRSFALAYHFMVFVSATIVTGLVSWFLNAYSERNAHIIFHEVIATITLALYLVAMILPLFRSYHGYLMPLNLVLSYLWLTCFIFATQDWAGGRCPSNGPGFGKCSMKKTIAAFDFLALFFLLGNVVAEWLLWRAERKPTDHVAHAKTRPGTSSTADANVANNV